MPCPVPPSDVKFQSKRRARSKLLVVMRQLTDAREVVLELLEGLEHGMAAELSGGIADVNTAEAFARKRRSPSWETAPAPPSPQDHPPMCTAPSAARPSSVVDTPSGNSAAIVASSRGVEVWPATVKLRDFHSDPPQAKTTVKGIAGALRITGEDRNRVTQTSLRDPTGKLHLIWNFVGLAVLIADLTLTPFMLAWDLPFDEPLRTYSIISLTFWTVDIAFTFTAGYYQDGVLITGFRHTARRHAKACLLDLVVVACDWVSIAILIGSGGGPNLSGAGVRLLRFTKFGRLLRIMVLLRVVRVMAIIESFAERIFVERVRKMLTLSSIALVLLWFIHVWFYISRSGISGGGRRWTDMFAEREEDLFEQYVVAYHWTVAQVTLGSNDVQSSNTGERIFNVCILITGLVMGSTLISTFSASMVELQMANKDRNHKLRTLRRYLRENEVGQSLSLAVQQQVNQRIHERKHLIEEQVMALQLLSSSFRAEVRFAVVRPSLFSHVLFVQLSTLDPGWCLDFCQDGFEIESLSAQDEIFISGGVAKFAYALMRGSATYTLEVVHFDQDSTPLVPPEETVEKGEWLAEATLWAEWTHVGKAVAAAGSQVLQVSPAGMRRSTLQYPDIHKVAAEYGAQYHRRIISAGTRGTDHPTDLYVPSTDWDDMVVSMNVQAQRIISFAAAERLVEDRRSTRRVTVRASDKHSALREEIASGKSIVVLNPQGAPERIVSVVVFHITGDDGRIFAQVGKYEHDTTTSTCELPGAKRESSELIGDAFSRLCATKLSPLQTSLHVLRTECLKTTKSSKQHQVQTKYLRHIFYCTLIEDFMAPTCSALEPFEAPVQPGAIPRGETFSTSATAHIVSDGTAADLGDLSTREVFFFRYGAKGAFYAWLSQREFEFLSSPAGERTASMWLRQIGRPPQADV